MLNVLQTSLLNDKYHIQNLVLILRYSDFNRAESADYNRAKQYISSNNIYHQTNNSYISKEYFQSVKFHMNVLEMQTTGFAMCNKHNFNMNAFKHGSIAALASPIEGPGYFYPSNSICFS